MHRLHVAFRLVVWIAICALEPAPAHWNATGAHAQPAASLPIAQDGRHLLRETGATQADFRAMWGDRAEQQWVEAHNRALAGARGISGPRIAYLSSTSATGTSPVGTDAFVARLSQLGYRPGKNISIDWYYTDGLVDVLPDVASAIVDTRPDLIVAAGAAESAAAGGATSVIPIVMVSVSDPLAAGLVASLKHPGGNVTGLTNTPVDIFGKRLAALSQAVPGLTKVAVLRIAPNPASAGTLHDAIVAAEQLNLEVIQVDVNRVPEDLPQAFDYAIAQGADGMLLLPDAIVNLNRSRVAELAIEHRLPVVAPGRAFAEAGALMAYGPSPTETPRRAADYVAQILRGADPAELGVGVPEEVEFVVNLTTAAAIGLTIPSSLATQTSGVIP
jgi:putative ABC transport system substrate-binding protein